MVNWRVTAVIACALCAFVLAVLSYLYLAPALFYVGLSRFYEIAPAVPDTCTNVVADAAVAFTAVFDYVSLGVAAALVIVGILLAAFAWRHSPHRISFDPS